MKINSRKTKVMVFNPTQSVEFVPNILLEDNKIEHISEIKLLGIHISSDMKWKSNTLNIVKKKLANGFGS